MAEAENQSKKSFVDGKVIAYVVLLLLALTEIFSNTRTLFFGSYGQSTISITSSFDNFSQSSLDDATRRRRQQQQDDDTLPCLSNPYLDALEDSTEEVMEKMDTWLDNVAIHGAEASDQ